MVKKKNLPDYIVKGRHILELGVLPGPQVGRILKELYRKQLDGEFHTLYDGIEIARGLLTEIDFEREEKKYDK